MRQHILLVSAIFLLTSACDAQLNREKVKSFAVLQNRDGNHHHHHHHEEPVGSSQPVYSGQQYQSTPSYHPVPVVEAPATSYEETEEEPQPTYEEQSAAAPAHTGYYYYYYPIKSGKAKLKLPTFAKIMSSLRLPQYYAKDDQTSSSSALALGIGATITSLLLASGFYLAMPLIGLGVGKRSALGNHLTTLINEDNMQALADFILNQIARYEENSISSQQ